MKLERIRQLALLAGGFRGFARTPVTYSQALADIRGRLANRERNFLDAAERLIYGIPCSPFRKLLLWAGCELADLRRTVETRGIDGTLAQLRDEGVYLTLAEFKSLVPICRRGLTFSTQPADFDNPFLIGGRIHGVTSGSRATSTRVMYDWDFIAEESSNELVLYTEHGVAEAPLALWFPVLPGLAGIHNLLMSLKHGATAERWFSHLPTNVPLESRLALEFICWSGKAVGVAMPRPEFADFSGVGKVVEWMEGARKRRGCCVVRTYGSSAVRIAQAALHMGSDLRGSVIFAGGEPLTDFRRRYIESAGVKVFPRYVASETGLVAAACPRRSDVDDMHFYSDRLAVIPRAGSYLFSTLLLHTAKVLFNCEMGDCGELVTKSCGCVFGELGLNIHLSGVRGQAKVTLEGMSVLSSELDRAIGAAIEQVGGGPDSYQFREERDGASLNRLVIAVSPEVTGLDTGKFIGDILERLARGGPGADLAAKVWAQAGTFQVVREAPRVSAWQKMSSAKGERASNEPL